MKRYIYSAAKDEEDDGFDDAVRNLKDDFDYAMDGLDKLHRSGSSDSLTLASSLSDCIQQIISSIAESIE